MSATQDRQTALLLEHMQDFNDVTKLTPELRQYVSRVEHHENPWNVLQHPLVYQVWGIHPHLANRIASQKRDAIREAIREKNWHNFIFLHERPYRLTMLSRIFYRHWIDRDTLRDLLLYVWTDTELPENQQGDALELFREADFTTDSPDTWKKLPASFDVFRGVDGQYEQTPLGMAWTTNRKVAEFFATRYDAKGKVYRYRATKLEALGWLTGRDEYEVIIDFHSDPAKENEITLDRDYSVE